MLVDMTWDTGVDAAPLQYLGSASVAQSQACGRSGMLIEQLPTQRYRLQDIGFKNKVR